MEILPRTDLNFDKLADTVSDTFFEDGTTLNEGVIKVAKQYQLNPEQTRRLVERTNTLATVKMLKTAKDKKAEFKLADYTEVRQVTHPSAPAQTTEKQAQAGDIPDRFPDIRSREKIKDVMFPTLKKEASQEKENHLATIFREQKRIEEFTREKMATEMRVQDSLDYIISEFSKWRAPDFSKFAGEALTVHGDIAGSALSKIAQYLEEPDDFEKVAYVVDDSQDLLVKIGKVVEGLNTIVELSHNLSEARNTLSEIWNKAKCNGAY